MATKKITATNPSTGQSVTIDWDDTTPQPNESDWDSIFASQKPLKSSFMQNVGASLENAPADFASRIGGMVGGTYQLLRHPLDTVMGAGKSIADIGSQIEEKGTAAVLGPPLKKYLKELPQHGVGAVMDALQFLVPESALTKLGTLGKIGKAGELIGKGLTPTTYLTGPLKVAGKALSTKELTPFQQAAHAEGMERYPISAGMQSPMMKKIESFFSTLSPYDAITAQIDESKAVITSKFSALVNDITGGQETFDIGKKWVGSFQDLNQEFDDMESKLYRKAKITASKSFTGGKEEVMERVPIPWSENPKYEPVQGAKGRYRNKATGEIIDPNLKGAKIPYDYKEVPKVTDTRNPVGKSTMGFNRTRILVKSILKDPTQAGTLENYKDLKGLEDFISQPRTLDQVDSMIRQLNKELKKAYDNPSLATGNEPEKMRIAHYLRNEFRTALGQVAPQLKKDLMAAKQFRTDNIGQIANLMLNDKSAANLLREGRYDKLLKSLIRPGVSEDDIMAIKAIARNPKFKNGKFMDDGMQAAVMDQIKAAATQIGKDQHPYIDVKLLSKAIDKWGDHELNLIFGHDIAARLRNKRAIAGTLGESKGTPFKGVAGISGAVVSAKDLVFSGDWKPAALMTMVQAGNLFLASEWGQKMIAEGMIDAKVASKVVKGATKATKGIGQAGLLESKMGGQ